MTHFLVCALAAFSVALASCDRHSHGDHDHDHDHDHHHHHDHDENAAHSHDDHDHGEDGHVHQKIEAGPNGGRLITSVEPHFEFLVTGDRKVRITFLEEDKKTAITPSEQVVSVIAGSRSNPTNLAFVKDGNSLLSDGVLPEGNDFPTVVQVQLKPGAEMNREKFNLNLVDCPTCDYLEYACICGHDGHDHVHPEEK